MGRKIVLVFTHKHDRAGKGVCEWLRFYGVAFIRLNEGDVISVRSVSFGSGQPAFRFTVNDGSEVFDSNDTVSFFRGGFIMLPDYFFDPGRARSTGSDLKHEIRSFLSNYSVSKLEYAIHALQQRSIGTNNLGRYNKLTALDYAGRCGLDIPPTLVTTQRSDVLAFAATHGQLITKSLDVSFSSTDAATGGWYMSYTALLSDAQLQALPAGFPLTKFQQRIGKLYELRIFYLNGSCFAGAVFSQGSDRTRVDMRRYDHQKMNRIVPYELPQAIQDKLRAFMNMADLDTGSIDMIVDHEGRHVFLEVNPVGQFGYLSESCNYNLEKEIAATALKL